MRQPAHAGPEALRRLLHRTEEQRGVPIRGRVLLPHRMSLSRAVDGVWWPHSCDLRAELPSVLPSVGLRLQKLECVHYSTADWTPLGRRLHPRDSASVELRLLSTPGLIVFTGARVSIVFALIAPNASAATAEAAAAHYLPTSAPCTPRTEVRHR